MKLEDVHAFVAVVRHASVTGAAKALKVRQPAITRRIQSLEEDLGVVLLDRNSKPSRPTAVGRRVYELCINVMRDVELVEELVRGDSSAAVPLRLGVAEVLAEVALLDAVPRLRGDYPAMQIELASGWSTEMVKRLYDNTLDAAIVVLPRNMHFGAGFTATSFGEMPMVVVAPKGMIAERKRLADLHQCEWVLSPDGCGFRELLRRAFTDQGLPFSVKIATFGTEQKLGLVASGAGLGFVPKCMLESSLYAPQLEAIELSDFQPTPHIWRVHPENLGRSVDFVERFCDVIKEEIALLDAGTEPSDPVSPRLRRSHTKAVEQPMGDSGACRP